jgi:hypothetical protein
MWHARRALAAPRGNWLALGTASYEKWLTTEY